MTIELLGLPPHTTNLIQMCGPIHIYIYILYIYIRGGKAKASGKPRQNTGLRGTSMVQKEPTSGQNFHSVAVPSFSHSLYITVHSCVL